MGIPSQKLTINDPGIGTVGQSSNAFLFMGCSEKGPNTMQPYSSKRAAVDILGQGQLTEDICYALDVAGGPVYGCRLSGSIAAASSSVTKTAIGSSTGTVAVSGSAFDSYEAILDIVLSGALGVARFKYSLDRGRTYSEEITIPGGGTYAIPFTNQSLTFTAGAGPVFFEKDDRFTYTTTAPHYGSTELAAGIDALGAYLSEAPDTVLDAIVLSGRSASAAAAATMFGAASVQLSGLEQRYRYLRLIMDAASGDTRSNVKTALSAVASTRVCVHYGDADTVSSKPFAGWGAPRTSGVRALGGRAARELISTDLARFNSGTLPGVLKIWHDEFQVEEMDVAKISTFRTHPNSTGFYVCNAWLKSPTGSDFRYWQHGRMMDVACRTVVQVQQTFSSRAIRVKKDGTGRIEESEASLLEEVARTPLEVALLEPDNVEGRKGHVTDVEYTIDRENNVLGSETIQSEVGVLPDGYAKHIKTQIGYTTATQVAA